MFGVGKGADLLMPPGLIKRKKWLAVTIYHGEEMPKIKSTGCNGMQIEVEVDHESITTTVTDCPQDTFEELENCYWTETLWIPLFLPTMATRIAFKLYPHFLFGKGRLPLATSFLNLSSILDSRSTAPQWLNFYGPAIGVRGSVFENINRMLRNTTLEHQRSNTNTGTVPRGVRS